MQKSVLNIKKSLLYKYMKPFNSSTQNIKKLLSPEQKQHILEFFNYEDALTGEKIFNESECIFEGIIPQKTLKHCDIRNLVPLKNKTDREDEFLPFWFKEQTFYDKKRYNKILRWMEHLKKYLYVPKEQIPYIDKRDNNISIQKYRIRVPFKRTEALHFSNIRNKEALGAMINKFVLEDNLKNIEKNWIADKQKGEKSIRAEQQYKSFLERCAGFLLLGELKNKMYCKMHEVEETYVPISSLSPAFQNWFYGIDSCNESISNIKTGLNEPSYEEDEEPFKKGKVKRVKPRHIKMRKIYGRPEINKIQYYALKDDEGNELKNIYNEKIIDYKWINLPEVKGIIDTSDKKNPYYADYPYVNALGRFRFGDYYWDIDLDACPQYIDYSKIDENQSRGGKIWSMDKIFCYAQKGNLFFFDMNVNEISLNKIKRSVFIC